MKVFEMSIFLLPDANDKNLELFVHSPVTASASEKHKVTYYIEDSQKLCAGKGHMFVYVQIIPR